MRGGASEQSTTEDLGFANQNGVLAQGTRTKTMNSDPRYGVTTYDLTNISQNAPDATLFQPPAGYTTAGTTFITSFDSSSSTFLGNITVVELSGPLSATPFILVEGDQSAGLNSGGWTGPFDHADTYFGTNATIIISGSSSAPEPSSFALIGGGGVLLAIVRRRRWSQKIAS